MRIEIQEINGPVKSSKGKWQEIELVYTDLKDDSNRTKTLVSFGDGQSVFEALEGGEYGPGDQAEVELKKSGKYWNWVGISKGDGEKSVVSKTSRPASQGTTSKSGWTPDPNRETKEERHLRNLAICRQNALTNAVNTLGVSEHNPDNIIELAERFFQYTAQDFAAKAIVTKAVTGEFK